MGEIKDRIQALARESGLTKKASVAEFLAMRANERKAEANGRKR